MMRYWLWIWMVWLTVNCQAQNLLEIVQHINPALYINNMDNKPVYHQFFLDNNSLTFVRLFWGTHRARKEQSYHYCFMSKRRRDWILEIRLDQHDFKISEEQGTQAIRSSDFGFKVYKLQGKEWQEITPEVLPEGFIDRFEEQFTYLQASSWGYYYYNQNPECVIYPHWERNILHFEQNGKKVLCLAWRKDHFVWK